MRNKNLFLIYYLFKGGDDTFDTKAVNLADVSSFSPCMVNLLLRIVQNASTLDNKFWLCCSFIKLTTCHALILLTFSDKLRVCVSREAVSKLTT